ncbi:hypothetical protein OH76DRAFT_1118100 [Lentinus brumalis]|uniref:Uncharacterized protein n=1 Tax=Lentinus brumalis TaxID=2498619 RepID=A0A371CUY1_9APHY|nr:hypothetical protein OH76DRAFT_1118100 [Polyporus brumalis]
MAIDDLNPPSSSGLAERSKAEDSDAPLDMLPQGLHAHISMTALDESSNIAAMSPRRANTDADTLESGSESEQACESSEDDPMDGEDDIGDLELSELFDTLRHSALYAYKCTYQWAPNPFIAVGNREPLGLPLSIRALVELKSYGTTRARLGEDEQTSPLKDSNADWIVNGNQISFHNPSWIEFIGKTQDNVKRALGVDPLAALTWKLRYLVLSGPGSSHLPQYRDRVDIMAAMLVVLPTSFLGGSVKVSHGGNRTLYSYDTNSLADTTVMAWRVDETPTMDPITDGYRLGLVYHLDIPASCSVLDNRQVDDRSLTMVQRYFRSWNGRRRSPRQLIYLLGGRYSRMNLSAKCLHDPDACLVTALSSLAAQSGFHMGLATLSCCYFEHTSYDHNEDLEQYGTILDYIRQTGTADGDISSSIFLENLVGLDGALLRPGRLDIRHAVIMQSDSSSDDLLDYCDENDLSHREVEAYDPYLNMNEGASRPAVMHCRCLLSEVITSACTFSSVLQDSSSHMAIVVA